MTPAEQTTPIDEALLAALLADEVTLAEGLPPAVDPGDARHGLLACLRLLRTLGPSAEPGPGPAGGESMIGRFAIRGEIGRGGFGIVYRAHDPLLGREVALKVPRPELIASPEIRRRFLREAHAAASLDHPNIVPVHEAGQLGPVCYIASAYCPGPTLAGWIKSQTEPVPPGVAARLVADLAAAVQHAHDRGVLHRDIKPSNVILDLGEAVKPSRLGITPRLTDFGLAKLVDEPDDETRTLAVLGSPPYMAPEQATGRNDRVGPATDVHALGTVLYELLAGLPPFRGESRSETLRRVIEEAPVAPRALRPRLPRDLETVALTCLAKDPSRRYNSAAALGEDLERFLRGEPILARPTPLVRRAWAGARRRPTLAASALLAVLSTVVVLLVLAWSNSRQRHMIVQLRSQRDRADLHAREGHRLRDLAERSLHGARVRLASQALDDGQFERAQDILHDLEPGPGQVDRREFAWHTLWRRAGCEVTPLYGHDRDVRTFAVSPDGRTLASGDTGGTARLWDIASGRPLATLEGHRDSIRNFSFTADSLHLASAASSMVAPCSEIFLWRLATRRVVSRVEGFAARILVGLGVEPGDRGLWAHYVSEISHESEIARYDLDLRPAPPRLGSSWRSPCQPHVLPNGRVVSVVPDEAARDDTWVARDAGPEVAEWILPASRVVLVPFAVTADSLVIAASIRGVAVVCRDARTGAELARLATDEVINELAFSPDGGTLAAGCDSGAVLLWALPTGRTLFLSANEAPRPKLHYSLDFSPDGTWLAARAWASSGWSSPVTLWSVADGQRLAEYPGRSDQVRDLAFAPDGRSLFLACGPTIRRWWPAREPGTTTPMGHADEAWALAFRPDGRVLASGSDDTDEPHTIKIWDPATGHLVRRWGGGRGTVSGLAFSHDGRVLASGHLGPLGNIRIWEPETGRLLATLPGHAAGTRSIAFHPNGKLLASAGSDRIVRLWDVSARRCVRELAGHAMTIQCVAFSPGGESLASASADGTVRLWDVGSGRPLRTLGGPEKFTAVAFAPGGLAVAAADERGTVTLWSTATGERIGAIRGEDGVLRCLAFTPDGRTLSTAGDEGKIQLWDPAGVQELMTLGLADNAVRTMAFSPDGQTLGTADLGGAVRLWRGR
jgi:WD40 repeat protein